MTRENISVKKLMHDSLLDLDDINYMLKNESIESLSQKELEDFNYHIGQAWNILIKKFKI